ncbi:MAG: dihydrofolate reductase family protein [Burkholderiaceae bacterium]
MPQIRVSGYTVSVDGYGAGPVQTLQQPMGRRGELLHGWMRETATFQKMMGKSGGSQGIDEEFAAAAMENLGAWIMGRNMFGPVRGPWPDDEWKGWWGSEPPYHCPVFVLTHHARPDLAMEGGTVFHFVTGGLDEAVRRAREAAGERDIRIGGGASTVRQCLERGYIDTMHVAVSPVLVGEGEPLFAGLDLPTLGYRIARRVEGEKAMHLVIDKSPP